MSLQKIFLSVGGAGRLPYPGFSSTLITLPLGVVLLFLVGAEALFTLTFALFLIGIFEINKFETRTGTHDDPSIVLDETVGLWLTLVITVHGLAFLSDRPYALPLAIFLSWGSFLLFDNWKPSTIGWIERNVKGGLGVMLDDVLAGFAAGMLNLLIFKGLTLLTA